MVSYFNLPNSSTLLSQCNKTGKRQNDNPNNVGFSLKFLSTFVQVEEELLMKRSLGGGAPDPGESDGGGGSTRSSRGSHWTKTARRSFLKRRKGGSSLARSSSRESKELATFRYQLCCIDG